MSDNWFEQHPEVRDYMLKHELERKMNDVTERLQYSILATRWLTNKYAFMGCVAIETDTHEFDATKRTWKAYIGICRGDDPKSDMHYIAAWGASLYEQEARGFFPEITRKYKDN